MEIRCGMRPLKRTAAATAVMPTSPLRSPVAAKLRATNNPRTPPCSTETQYDDLDCCGLLRAGRGQCRQGCVALNLGLEAVAIFKSGLAEGVFRVPLSIPDKFGGLIEITLRNDSAPRRMTCGGALLLVGAPGGIV